MCPQSTLYGAKEVATKHHISGGRFGLNIVAGWNEREIAMFGVPQKEHDVRYDVADDWISLCKELWTVEGEFDYAGPHFTSPGCYSEPKPLQKPWPALMSAGNGEGQVLPQPMRTLTLWSRKIWRPRGMR